MLIDKFHSRSQRDLGWQVFQEQNQYDVERAFLMSKSMQLRFRWDVNAKGLPMVVEQNLYVQFRWSKIRNLSILIYLIQELTVAACNVMNRL